MICVEVYGNFETALKRFSKRVTDGGIFKEIKDRLRCETRSQRRKRKDHEAMVRRLKKEKRRDERN